jgi:hypothetical protein
MRDKMLFAAFFVMTIYGLAVTPAGAVKYGELDGDLHPHVVLLLMEVDGAPAFRCSGTLLSATVLLTAGHCTNNFPGSPYTGMRVFTESDVQAGTGTTNNYPLPAPTAWKRFPGLLIPFTKQPRSSSMMSAW